MSRQLISSKMVGLTLFYFIIALGNKKHISYGKLKDDDKSTENCLNQLGRQLDNNAKHRHASRTYEITCDPTERNSGTRILKVRRCHLSSSSQTFKHVYNLTGLQPCSMKQIAIDNLVLVLT